MPNSSPGMPPVPDGLAHKIIFNVPPLLGAAAGVVVGVDVVVIVGVDVVVVGVVVVTGGLVVVDVVVVAGGVVVFDVPQPRISVEIVINATKMIISLFISYSLLF